MLDMIYKYVQCEMFIKVRHSFMQRARMMGRKDY
jgi:hypothetical protein